MITTVTAFLAARFVLSELLIKFRAGLLTPEEQQFLITLDREVANFRRCG